MLTTDLDIKSPNDLHRWLEKNITYEGVNKGYLRLPSELIDDKKAHCWETTNFERLILKELGLLTATFYLEDRGCKVTHTTLIYTNNSKVYWFEWAWRAFSGIHEFNSENEAIDAIRNAFLYENGSIEVFTRSDQPIIRKGDTEKDCVSRMQNWTSAEYGKTISGFQTIETTKANIDFFKNWFPSLRHVRVNPETSGLLLIDFSTSKVVAVLQCHPRSGNIVALETSPLYQKQGIAEELLHQAISVFNCPRLSVNKKNTKAVDFYQKRHWIVIREDASMLYMEHRKKEVKPIVPVYKRW